MQLQVAVFTRVLAFSDHATHLQEYVIFFLVKIKCLNISQHIHVFFVYTPFGPLAVSCVPRISYPQVLVLKAGWVP